MLLAVRVLSESGRLVFTAISAWMSGSVLFRVCECRLSYLYFFSSVLSAISGQQNAPTTATATLEPTRYPKLEPARKPTRGPEASFARNLTMGGKFSTEAPSEL